MNLRKKTGKNSAKPSRQKSAVPRTAQQSIPMQRMFEDGTCRTGWRAPRPIPEDDDFFENVWRSYRETGNIY